MISLFCPFRDNSPCHFIVNGPFVKAFVNGAAHDGLSVDYFTALSITAHSYLSSLEREHLLITMGLKPSQFREWKFGSLSFGKIGEQAGVAPT